MATHSQTGGPVKSLAAHKALQSGSRLVSLKAISSTTIPVSALGLLIILCWGNSLWISGKALLAQYLIADAWQQSLALQEPIRPWSWADTWPVAKLDFPSLQHQLYVLAGSHGTSLAFGPGHVDGTALPHESGTIVINGHRDTHFNVLAELAVGDVVKLQSQSGKWQQYEIITTEVVDTRTTVWLIQPNAEELHLMTCYPFNSIDVDPPLRYVVVAELLPQ